MLQKSFSSKDHPVTSTTFSPVRKLSLEAEPTSTNEIEFSFKSIGSIEDDAPNSQMDNIWSQDDSFVISDDEINYSMKPTSNPKHSRYPRTSSCTFDDAHPGGSEDYEPADLEVSRYIFDEDFDDDPFIETANRYDADADIEMMERSIRDIVQQDFLANATKSGTKLTRTKSDVPIGLHKHHIQSISKVHSFRDDSFVVPKNTVNDEIDEFDLLVNGNITSRSDLSPATVSEKRMELISERIDLTASPDDRHASSPREREFEVRNRDQIYHVKFGPNVTPKPNYEAMDTPTRLIELRRYGLKALSKRKAVICLEHIYNRMHPFIEHDQARPIITSKPEPVRSDSFDAFFDLEPREFRTDLESQGNPSDNDDEPILTQAVDIELGPLSTQPIGKSLNLNLGTSNGLDHMFVPFIAEQTQYFLPSMPRKKVI